MALVIIRHRIGDYAKWKKEFDGFLEKRRAGGERTFRVAHITTDPNNLCLVFDWDSAVNAKRFLDSPDLASAMKRAGVTDKPDIYVAEDLTSGQT